MTSSIGPDSALGTGPAVTEPTTAGKVFIFGAMRRCFQDNRLLNKWTFDPMELWGFRKNGPSEKVEYNLTCIFLCLFVVLSHRVNINRSSSGREYVDLLVFPQSLESSLWISVLWFM